MQGEVFPFVIIGFTFDGDFEVMNIFGLPTLVESVMASTLA